MKIPPLFKLFPFEILLACSAGSLSRSRNFYRIFLSLLLKDGLGVVEFNDVIRVVTGISQIAVSAHAQKSVIKNSQNVTKSP